MKKYILIGILSFFVQCVFAQEDTAAQLVYQDTVVTEIRISSENDTNTNVQSSLPMMLQQHTQKSGLPSVTNIAAEVPNDTVKPKVTFKVVPTEKTIPDEPESAEKPDHSKKDPKQKKIPRKASSADCKAVKNKTVQRSQTEN